MKSGEQILEPRRKILAEGPAVVEDNRFLTFFYKRGERLS